MVVLSSVTASVIGRAALGDQPVPAPCRPSTSTHLAQYLLFAVLGRAGRRGRGRLHPGPVRIEDACDWAWRGPEWLRPAVGGVLLGVAAAGAAARCTASDTRCWATQSPARYAVGFLFVLLVGQDGRLQSDHRHRRFRRRLRAQPVHAARCSAPPSATALHHARPRHRRVRRRLRADRDGRGLRRRRPRARSPRWSSCSS